ncbi:MAG: hypothetical protein IIT86_06430 [Oscillospiraceae bacterium]|jgi:hypothetical protein|nr:hypothetical protein [Clostridia bacterium]MBQ1554684.1 hypothetical protein [Clostridia bacterium]MBQ2488154.1 hypothetical protein [Ruminococcus sp.]MBQ5522430.1 hypothetical protein [Oscillospiraceae bacterium]
MEQQPVLFRQKSLDRISEPDQLTDYLRVTKPAVWLLLAAILVLLVGLLVWSLTGNVEITADGDAVIVDGQAKIMLADNEAYQLDKGMRVMIDDHAAMITSIEANEFGKPVGYASVNQSDGTYSVSIVVRTAHPFELLFGA